MNKRTEMIKRLNSIYQIFRWKSFGIKLLLLVGLLAFTQKAEAGRDTWSDADRYFYATFDDSKGCIVIYVRQGDNDFGPAGENGYVENATIKVNGQEIIKMSASDAGNSGYQSNAVGAGECEDNSLSASGFTNETGVGSGGSCNYRRFRWYPNQTLTGKVNVSISGTWDVNGAYHYDNMSATREITIPGIGGIEYKNTVLKTTSEGDTITILTFTKTINSNLDTKDQYELLDANGDRVTSATCVSSSDRKTVTVTIPTIEEYSKQYTLRYYFQIKPNRATYETSRQQRINGFGFPSNFKASFNSSDKRVTLQWNCIADVQGTFTNNFMIQRLDNKKWIDIATVNFDKNNSNYTYSDDYFKKQNVTEKVSYRLKRIIGGEEKDWNVYATADVFISTKHTAVNGGTLVYDPLKNEATLEWGITAAPDEEERGQWSEGTKFIICRYNMTVNTREDIVLDKESFLQRKYVDNMINLCNKYYYTLQIQPGGDYDTAPAVKTETFTPQEIGTLQSINTSKGYFGEYVNIRWRAIGAFDKFVIERRDITDPKSTYMQINMADASESVSEYTYVDKDGSAGITYDYRIFGVVKCASDTLRSDTLHDIGFRTPTGSLYGRVKFANEQGVENVEVYLEAENTAYMAGKSYQFDGAGTLEVTNTNLLSQATTAITLQAYVKPVAKQTATIVSKQEMYELGLSEGIPVFKVGTETLMAKNALEVNRYSHLTGVCSKDSMYIYVDGKIAVQSLRSTKRVSSKDVPVVMGEGFKGYIDEVRLWNISLDSVTVARDYNRYLVGNEAGLEAYYTFNYSVDTDFYDISYLGSTYNENHGKVIGAVLSEDIPSNEQLGYRGVTASDGSYSILGIPYSGNGTTYTIIPHLGIHQFVSAKEVRKFGTGAQSYTIDFIDKSSFPVSGFIYYNGTTIPVEGVSFNIDGQTAMDGKGKIITTDSDGAFSISVPVGEHEVRAVKQNHIFESDGRFTDINGNDINYTDEPDPFRLYDLTTVRYIGRVAGGRIQEGLPVGHNLSTNNLGENVTITMTYGTKGREFESNVWDSVYIHPICQEIMDKGAKAETYKTKVTVKENVMTVYPDEQTGEFMLDVIPESFRYVVNTPGIYEDKITSSTIDFSKAFAVNYEKHEYVDDNSTERVDSISYNSMSKFIVRVNPTIEIKQMSGSKAVDYFGMDTISVNKIDGTVVKVPLYDPESKTYTLGHPVFNQNSNNRFRVQVYENYPYCLISGIDENRAADRVPCEEATISFNNQLSKAINVELDSLDEKGYAYYNFKADAEINQTSGEKKLSATAAIKVSEGTVSSNWNLEPDALFLGAASEGNDFVTKGPDKVLTILRDPPGSNSYSYLEKGVTFSSSTSKSTGFSNEGEEGIETSIGADVIVWAGVGAGTITKTESEENIGLAVTHTTESTGTSTSESSTTLTTRFQTSEDPNYVGSDGDVFIGYSTNISYGSRKCLTVMERSEANDKGETVKIISPNDGSKYVIVLANALALNQEFATLFAYPQVHIVNRLIPEMEDIRNKFLMLDTEGRGDAFYQDFATINDSIIYVSRLDTEDENFGKSNDDKDAFGAKISTNPYDGPSYKAFIPKTETFKEKAWNDTIHILNESIKQWEKMLAKNEEEKIEATLLQNYSYHAGSPIEYSEETSNVSSYESEFTFTIGENVSTDSGFEIMGSGTSFKFSEAFTATTGSSDSESTEKRALKGFMLADDGADYLSVDVCRQKGKDTFEVGTNPDEMTNADKDNYFTSFVFRTKAGATSCPYEREERAKYSSKYRNQIINEATRQIEKPVLSIDKNFIENVPSGESAYVTLRLQNESETNDDAYYTLRIRDDQATEDGAQFYMDGMAMIEGRSILVPAGETITKTLEVRKGKALEYDNITIALESQCQCDPTDYLPEIESVQQFSVHFTKACTTVNIQKPGNNWVYNTDMPLVDPDDLNSRYMNVVLDKFDVNYDNFYCIRLQIKPSGDPDEDQNWTTVREFYNDQTLCDAVNENNGSAEMIDSKLYGKIQYKLQLNGSNYPDQRYDLRAVSVCMIGNEEVLNISEVNSGIKDTYNPRLFGNAKPANGILTVNDEIRLDFNEPIADGYLTENNFQVTGVRNGTKTDHSVSVRLDGLNDYFETEFIRNFDNKDVTVEMWFAADQVKDAVLFSHGDINNSFEIGVTADEHLKIRVNSVDYISEESYTDAKQGNWGYITVTLTADGEMTAYFNGDPYITSQPVGVYTGEGHFVLGKGIAVEGNNFSGMMHNVRVWDKILTKAEIQTNNLTLLSGSEQNLLAYYPMNAGKGEVLEDKARGANMIMNGGTWALPEGRAVKLDGSNYVTLPTSRSIILNSEDYSIEFWFKGEAGQANVAFVSNGMGDLDQQDRRDFQNYFFIGYENGELTFRNDTIKVITEGDYLDNNWHHYALSVNRTIGRAQIVIDGNLKTYFEADGLLGISSTSTYLGARVWTPKDQATVVNKDFLFNGSIDDFRMWNLYRGESMIAETMNERLNGTEKGLLCYFPFETYVTHQGQQELVFTLDDLKEKSAAESTLTGEAVGGSNVESVDIAPVKDKGPVSNLKYHFVVNNDALIITLDEALEKIENTIVTFTVDNVRDQNGNKILSPITWSAYIDCNQLRWSEEEIEAEKMAYEPLELEVKIMNNGGSIQNFTIDNLPTWMDATPSTGSLNPLSSVNIVLTIDEGLNVGTYDEVIYVRGNDNVPEALPITVKVNGEKPDWTVNPADFEYSMSVFGKMRFNNIFSTDKEDILAAFENGQCVGVANSSYDKDHDMWYTFLTIYNNEKETNGLEFRMWDASTGKIYSATPQQEILFVNGGMAGTAKDPIIFDGKELFYQDMALISGWNWLSFNLYNNHLSDLTTTLINGEWTSGDQIKSEKDFADYSTKGSNKVWTGPLTDTGFSNTSLYMLNTAKEQILSTSGTIVDVKTTPISIKGGGRWNYIGYLPSVNFTVKEALAGYEASEGDVVKSQNKFTMYSGKGWIGNLTYMEAGKGYMLLRKDAKDVTFNYPATAGSLSGQQKARTRMSTDENDYLNSSYADNMNVLAIGEELVKGDKVLAYIDGELRGVGDAIDVSGQAMNFINIVGNDADKVVSFALERNGEVIAYANNTVNYKSNSVQGTLINPIVLDFRSKDTSAFVYPSPFTTLLNISVSVNTGDDVEITIYDVVGQIIKRQSDRVTYSGTYHTVWDGKNGVGGVCERGVYFVHIAVNGEVDTYKVEKKD